MQGDSVTSECLVVRVEPGSEFCCCYTKQGKMANNILRILLLWLTGNLLLQTLGDDSSSEQFDFNSPHHRSRREVVASSAPVQPSTEYPVVLFSEVDYNNNTLNGHYHRLKEEDFRVWGRTVIDQKREFVYRSLLAMPNRTLTFKACCLGGNLWTASVMGITNISNIHLWMFDNQDISGSSGVWYTEWMHWIMDFSVKVRSCSISDCPPINCGSKICYFGTCGVDLNCQCTSGYSGENCETSPSNPALYPSLQYPLLLFPEKHFEGTPANIAPDTFKVFAQNRENSKKLLYKSLRVLFGRKISFQRVDHNVVRDVLPGADIEDIEAYMVMNDDVAKDVWFNYSPQIILDFALKVADNPSCRNCSIAGGSCYTGTCICLPNYSGQDCESSI